MKMTRNLASFFFTLLFFLTSEFSFAQSKLTVGKHKLKHHVFNLTKDGKSIAVLEENTRFRSGKEYDGSKWYGFIPAYSTKEDVKRSVVRVIGLNRIKRLPPNERLVIAITVGHQGEILEIAYFIGEQCAITLEELDRISDYIKANVKMKIPKGMLVTKLGAVMEVIQFDDFKKWRTW